MTIPTQQSTQIFIGNGLTNAFDFTFVGDNATYIVVTYTDLDGNATVLSPSQYTIFLNAPAIGSLWGIGGTVTYPTIGSPIANGTTLTVSRILPLTQIDSISNQGDFAPDVIESALDTLEMQIQQTSARTGLFRGTWATNITYNFGDYVIDGSNGSDTQNYYLCVITNLSTVWSTDLAAGDWTLVINIQSILADVAAAAASAAAAATSEGNAAVSASNAAVSATNASNSATASANSATSASNSATSAAASAITAATFGSTLKGTSTSSNTIGTGTKSFTTQSGLTFVAGGFVVTVDQGNPANYMHGQVTSYSGTSLVLNITDAGGSGTISAWDIILSGTQGPSAITNNESANTVYAGPTSGAMAAPTFRALVAADLPTTGFDVGLITMGLSATPPTGKLTINGDSIGSPTSGATHASADYAALYAYWWNNVSTPSINTRAVVTGGLGANAAADFAANKKLTMPTFADRSPYGVGSLLTYGAAISGATTVASVGTNASDITGGTTISLAQLTAHFHKSMATIFNGGGFTGDTNGTGSSTCKAQVQIANTINLPEWLTESVGGGGSHTHTIPAIVYTGTPTSVIHPVFGVYYYINY